MLESPAIALGAPPSPGSPCVPAFTLDFVFIRFRPLLVVVSVRRRRSVSRRPRLGLTATRVPAL
jgi:hypothetical protein